jgi:O-acetylhomoserine (thiol)-lyase
MNNLLINPEFGARVQLVTVITNAPLEPSPVPKKGLCKRWQKVCDQACVKMCPVECISEKEKFNKELCIYYHNKYLSEGFHIYVPNLLCGLCMKACKGFD